MHVIGIIHNSIESNNKSTNDDDNISTYSSSSFIPAINSLQTCCNTSITSPDLLNHNHLNSKEMDVVACNVQGVPSRTFHTTNVNVLDLLTTTPPNIYCHIDGNDYDVVIKLQKAFLKRTRKYFSIDLYNNNNTTIIEDNNNNNKIPMHLKQKDTYNTTIYKICINPDLSTNYSTKTMNAIIQNQFVLLPTQNACNLSYFSEYDNVLLYKNEDEFCDLLMYAMKYEPLINGDDFMHEFSWMAGTQRLVGLFS